VWNQCHAIATKLQDIHPESTDPSPGKDPVGWLIWNNLNIKYVINHFSLPDAAKGRGLMLVTNLGIYQANTIPRVT
jgi:hypothetical protein